MIVVVTDELAFLVWVDEELAKIFADRGSEIGGRGGGGGGLLALFLVTSEAVVVVLALCVELWLLFGISSRETKKGKRAF